MKFKRLYNIIFPLWFAYFLPPFVFLVLFGNLLIDGFVIYLFFKWHNLHFEQKSFIFFILKAWGLGFLADFIGGILILLTSESLNISEYRIWDSPITIITYSIIVFITAVLIFYFNYRLALSNGIEHKQAGKYGLFMAVFTAPYTFLIPTPWV